MWYQECGPESDVILSSRVRLARNIKGIPFPARANEDQQEQVLSACREAVQNSKDEIGAELKYIDLEKMEEYEKQALAERHLMSPQMIDNSVKRCLLLSDDNKISIMVNEEDHVRIQCMAAGFDMDECFEMANRIDDMMEEKLEYGFDEQFGYLTCCPTNVGTGLRASVMLHLPALVESGTISKISNSLSQLGLAVRGIYGEGSKAVGNIFQISNQVTLGTTEDEVIEKFKQVVTEVVEQERELRKRLFESQRYTLEDKLMRSYGILSKAVILSSNEAMKRLSDVRFGIYLGLITETDLEALNRITYEILPANIMKNYNILDAAERDLKRAELIRDLLK